MNAIVYFSNLKKSGPPRCTEVPAGFTDITEISCQDSAQITSLMTQSPKVLVVCLGEPALRVGWDIKCMQYIREATGIYRIYPNYIWYMDRISMG